MLDRELALYSFLMRENIAFFRLVLSARFTDRSAWLKSLEKSGKAGDGIPPLVRCFQDAAGAKVIVLSLPEHDAVPPGLVPLDPDVPFYDLPMGMVFGSGGQWSLLAEQALADSNQMLLFPACSCKSSVGMQADVFFGAFLEKVGAVCEYYEI